MPLNLPRSFLFIFYLVCFFEPVPKNPSASCPFPSIEQFRESFSYQTAKMSANRTRGKDGGIELRNVSALENGDEQLTKREYTEINDNDQLARLGKKAILKVRRTSVAH